ncbi:hypothetical protein COY87_03190 [Candidatus Roizmanbacteria bacterium CG_4_10_14_0_8_um_filter_33_9]|uniref:Uncharacterized protein n=1 Tax=Candidatus Roizmanbacteria bacterium CG_4_10_14_0_8_um_filter_33_9 TaxID=1974826 RepID=A0A2M7QI70_9BACT|nr:MAG: hypothetical protein COY87_03190 [Candidatus Roizmanbacteria bacterium CG_4_10_14_0_8_um_filter_33_9]
MNKQGLLLCAKYSVAPNFFGYCGPDENKSLTDHLKEGIADQEVQSILSEFETLYLNLTLIAKENNISDKFDKKVVEAYWLGNQLLQHISSKDYSYLLDEKFHLAKKLGNKGLNILTHKLNTQKIYPHHSFHVFNIFKRTGNDPSFHTLRTMDECRIGWGRVIKSQISKFKSQNGKTDVIVMVETKPLLLKDNKLMLGNAIKKESKINYKDTLLCVDLKQGDWVSFHWGHVCDKLTLSQVKNLKYYTQKAIDFYNE